VSIRPPSQLKTSREGVRPELHEARLHEIRLHDKDVMMEGSATLHRATTDEQLERLRDAFDRDQKVVLAIDPHNGNILGVYEPPRSRWEIGE
jgi:hypothetical protein